MVHESMVTEPPVTPTPPPCKQRATRESPMGAMGKYRSLRHIHKAIVDQSVGRSCASESRGKHVSNFPIGAMGSFEDERAHRQLCSHLWCTMTRSLCLNRHRHRHPANNEQNVSQRWRWEIFIGAMGIRRQGWHVPIPGRTRFDPN
jgi:hypothetical protein